MTSRNWKNSAKVELELGYLGTELGSFGSKLSKNGVHGSRGIIREVLTSHTPFPLTLSSFLYVVDYTLHSVLVYAASCSEEEE